jgi:CIC family chloride channel protein
VTSRGIEGSGGPATGLESDVVPAGRGPGDRPIAVLLLHAGIAGVLIGALATAFRLLAAHTFELHGVLAGAVRHVPVVAWLVPAGLTALMLLVSLELVRRFSPESAGSGVHEIEGALAGVRPLRWWRVIPTKFAAGVLSLGSGLALGREGPTIQMGGNLGQLLAVRLCLSAADAHALVAGGAAAGLAAAFNAPLSGIIFVIEEMRRHFRYGFRSFQSVLVCTALSDATVRALTGQQPVIEMSVFEPVPLSSLWVFPLFGVVLGVVGVGFNRALLVSLDFFSGLRGLAFSLRGLWVGAAVGLLAFFSAVSVGGGYTVVGDALAMRFSVGMLFALFALRFLTTVVSYSATVRAPITGIALAIEMTGNFDQILPLILTCASAAGAAEGLGGQPIYSVLLKRTLGGAVSSATAASSDP